MTRPQNLSYEDFQRYDKIIDQDPRIPEALASQPIIREVLYAGLYLAEQLSELSCPSEYIVRIQYTAGQVSYGRDPWEVHCNILEMFKNNKLDFETDPDVLN